MSFTTRFAPSPTGPLHLGHAYSAKRGFDLAQAVRGRFLLRIEDIDRSRARAAWEEQIYDDLAWLGLTWEQPVMRQSERMTVYEAALDALWAGGLLYPCGCSRADIAAATSAPQEGAPLLGPDRVVYPGTCRPLAAPTGLRPTDVPLRLDMAKACSLIKLPLHFTEEGRGNPKTISFDTADMVASVGDIVLSRRDMGTSYHLSVVLDDAAQDITHVVRGRDLFDATRIHIVLQHLLGLPHPIYHHHRLIRDEDGKRLAKRDNARAISKYRADGMSKIEIHYVLGI